MLNTFPIIVEFKIGNVSQYTSGMKGASAATDRMGHVAKKTGREVAQMAGAFTAIVVARHVKNGIGAMLRGLSDLQVGMSRLKLMTKLTDDQLQTFKKTAQNIAAETSAAPAQILELMQQLRRASGSDTDAMVGAEASAKLMQASFGKMNLDQSGKMMRDMLRSFRLTGDEIMAASDKVYEISKATGGDITEISNVMGRLGGAAMRAGQSFDSIIKAFYLAKTSGENAETIATGLRRVAGELASGKAQAAMEQLGITLVDNQGNVRDFLDIFMEMSQKFDSNSTVVRRALNSAFDERTAKTALYIMNAFQKGMYNENGELVRNIELKEYLDRMAQRGGGIDKASQAYLEQMVGLWGELRETAWNALMKISEPLVAVTTGILRFGKALADGVNWVFDAAPVLKTMASILGGTLLAAVTILVSKAAFGGLVTILGMVLSKVTFSIGPLSWLAKGLFALIVPAKGASLGLWALNLALRATATGFRTFLAATGVGLVIVGLSLIVEYWDEIKTAILAAGDALNKFSVNSVKWIKEQLGMKNTDGGTLFGIPITYNDAINKRNAQINEEKKLAEIQKNAAKYTYDHWTMASDEFNKVLNRIEGMVKYKPPKINYKPFVELRNKFAEAAAGKYGSQYVEKGAAMKAGADRLASIRMKADKEKRRLTPRETSEIQEISSAMLVAARDMSIMSGGKIVSKRFIDDEFIKKFVEPYSQLGTAQNQQYGSLLQIPEGGKDLANPEKNIPGFAGHLGRFFEGGRDLLFGKPNALHASMLPGKEKSLAAMGVGSKQAAEMAQFYTNPVVATLKGLLPKEAEGTLRDIRDDMRRLADALTGSKGAGEEPLQSSGNYPFPLGG